jgi:hypothetical protein
VITPTIWSSRLRMYFSTCSPHLVVTMAAPA